jgi:N,N'-diacetylbacillosaminyl-diphospho-undecaprenol alpha-1,3-N-acetylgalactosaminyltransferase
MKALFICNTDGALFVFRKPIISSLITTGNVVESISGKSEYIEQLRTLGVAAHELDFVRHSVSLLQNALLTFKLNRMVRLCAPDIVHNFTHKPAIYGSLAARAAGVSRIYVTITGLGTLFTNHDLKSRFLREFLLLQYRIALRFVHTVFFQNPDDRAFFLSRKIVRSEQAVLINGSGIDLQEFDFPTNGENSQARAMLSDELGLDLQDRQVVLFPARGVRDKGFFEYYEAAKQLTLKAPNRFVFLHLGLVDEAVQGHISKNGIEAFAKQCGVHYLGFKHNIGEYMKASDIVTLPSYREGVPRSLIEALALGRAIVTTDAPGCRETVVDGWNGFLCKPQDAISLAQQLERTTPDFCATAAGRARILCEDKFDARHLVQITLDRYDQSK